MPDHELTDNQARSAVLPLGRPLLGEGERSLVASSLLNTSPEISDSIR